ncbi:UNVERIFIED_CONTAM: hypothetical protein FKN15_014476 [Acipenser sinensis]
MKHQIHVNYISYNSGGDLRLVNGSSPCAGRVEILHAGQWGTVCSGGWDIEDAGVVCKQLGCGSAVSAPIEAHFGAGSGTIWLALVSCNDSQSALRDCGSWGWGDTSFCTHALDAGVICSGGGDLRLVNGSSPCAGRVEILHAGQWGTVCSGGWDIEDAGVVCKQLGCGSAVSAPIEAHFGAGSGTIWLALVSCNDSQSALRDCGSWGWGDTSFCTHALDAGVICSVKTTEAGPDSTTEGPAAAGVVEGAQEGPPKEHLPRAPPSSDGDTGPETCVAEEGAAETAPEAGVGSADNAEPMQATSAEGPEGEEEPPQEQEPPRAPEASMACLPEEGAAETAPEAEAGSAGNAEPMQATPAEGPEGEEEQPPQEQELPLKQQPPRASLSGGGEGSGPRAAVGGETEAVLVTDAEEGEGPERVYPLSLGEGGEGPERVDPLPSRKEDGPETVPRTSKEGPRAGTTRPSGSAAYVERPSAPLKSRVQTVPARVPPPISPAASPGGGALGESVKIKIRCNALTHQQQELPQASLSCGDGGFGPRDAAEGEEITPPEADAGSAEPALTLVSGARKGGEEPERAEGGALEVDPLPEVQRGQKTGPRPSIEGPFPVTEGAQEEPLKQLLPRASLSGGGAGSGPCAAVGGETEAVPVTDAEAGEGPERVYPLSLGEGGEGPERVDPLPSRAEDGPETVPRTSKEGPRAGTRPSGSAAYAERPSAPPKSRVQTVPARVPPPISPAASPGGGTLGESVKIKIRRNALTHQRECVVLLHREGGGGEPEEREEDSESACSVGSESLSAPSPDIPAAELLDFLETTIHRRDKVQLALDKWGDFQRILHSVRSFLRASHASKTSGTCVHIRARKFHDQLVNFGRSQDLP